MLHFLSVWFLPEGNNGAFIKKTSMMMWYYCIPYKPHHTVKKKQNSKKFHEWFFFFFLLFLDLANSFLFYLHFSDVSFYIYALMSNFDNIFYFKELFTVFLYKKRFPLVFKWKVLRQSKVEKKLFIFVISSSATYSYSSYYFVFLFFSISSFVLFYIDTQNFFFLNSYLNPTIFKHKIQHRKIISVESSITFLFFFDSFSTSEKTFFNGTCDNFSRPIPVNNEHKLNNF